MRKPKNCSYTNGGCLDTDTGLHWRCVDGKPVELRNTYANQAKMSLWLHVQNDKGYQKIPADILELWLDMVWPGIKGIYFMLLLIVLSPILPWLRAWFKRKDARKQVKQAKGEIY